MITHDAFIHEKLNVSTELELTGGYRRARPFKPVPPRFTHVLEPARPIEGIVTDKETGQPLSGMHVEIGSTGFGSFPTTTDAAGRYRVNGVAWNNPPGLHAQLIPDATSGYLSTQHQRTGWPPARIGPAVESDRQERPFRPRQGDRRRFTAAHSRRPGGQRAQSQRNDDRPRGKLLALHRPKLSFALF